MWMSSGFEDYFLVAYFHNPYTKAHLADSGFERNAVAVPLGGDANSVQAYRIHETDPVLFTDSLELQWEAPIGNGLDATCPRDWPQKPLPEPKPVPNAEPVTVQSYAWVYRW